MKPDTTAAGMRERIADGISDALYRSHFPVDGVLATLPVSLQELADIADGRKRVVPVEPTEAMLKASRGALKVFIDAHPGRRAVSIRGGTMVPTNMKIRLRWAAMLEALPLPPKDPAP